MWKKPGLILFIIVAVVLAGCNMPGRGGDGPEGGGLSFDIRPDGPQPTATFPPTAIPDLTLGEDGRDTTAEDPLSIGGRWGSSMKEGEAHNYTFEGATGQAIRINLQRVGDTGNPAFDLYGPDGQLILGDATSGLETYDALATIELPEDGLYTIRVYMYDVRAGSYAINLEEE